MESYILFLTDSTSVELVMNICLVIMAFINPVYKLADPWG